MAGLTVKTKFNTVLLATLMVLGFATGALAQNQAWLQIEAQPSLTAAQDRARAYAALFPNVAGFRVGAGWYGIVLGPYAPAAAAGRLNDLKLENMIPADSFITDGSAHGQQFWPVGQPALPETETPAVALPDPTGAPDPAPLVVVAAPDETLKQAKQSEAALTRDDRIALQQAMAWYGFYAAALDGAFGPGTRDSMAAWQEAKGIEATGVLTTQQRATLLTSYKADQAEFGFVTLTEPEAGIEITLPGSLVQFDHYEPPFVYFNAKNASGLRVILISEPGNQDSLFGLYDVLQTLEVVPAMGARSRDDTSFTINAASTTVESYAYAEAKNGMIKGFLVVWNPSDAERMTRILPVLKASFRPVGDKALDPGLVPMDEAARSGLLSGLEVTTPKFSRSGFYIDAKGSVLTTVEAVAQCGRVTIDHETDAAVTLSDGPSGLAVLTPKAALAPQAFANFQTAPVRLGSEIAVAGYSYEDKLPAAVLTFGSLKENTGLNGEPGVSRLEIPSLPGDAGGPLLDQTGAVLGMLLPTAVGGARILPRGVAFAASSDIIAQVLTKAGITPTTAATTIAATPDALNSAALGMTVLVSCWE